MDCDDYFNVSSGSVVGINRDYDETVMRIENEDELYRREVVKDSEGRERVLIAHFNVEA